MKGSEQPTSEKNYKSPQSAYTVWSKRQLPKKSYKIYKTLETYSITETELNNVGAQRRDSRSEDKETSLAPGTSAGTSEPTLDLLPNPVEG